MLHFVILAKLLSKLLKTDTCMMIKKNEDILFGPVKFVDDSTLAYAN